MTSKDTHGVRSSGFRLPACISLVESERTGKSLNESTNAEMAAARKDVADAPVVPLAGFGGMRV